MTRNDKRTIAFAILRQADRLDHPVHAVSVSDRFAYVMDRMPNRKGNGGRCIRYRHNCENLDIAALFARDAQASFTIHLTAPDVNEPDEDEDNLDITVTPADLIDRSKH